jgi:hypothetical protein
MQQSCYVMLLLQTEQLGRCKMMTIHQRKCMECPGKEIQTAANPAEHTD